MVMPTFDVDREQINAFLVDGTYMFKQYFEADAVFAELQQYYNSERYRFEVPAEELEAVRDLLAEHFYELDVVEDLKSFCVVQRKDTDRPDLLVRNAVLQRSAGEYNVFLLKDQLTVEQAVNRGATPLVDVDVAVAL